jgi:hypothetical protein
MAPSSSLRGECLTGTGRWGAIDAGAPCSLEVILARGVDAPGSNSLYGNAWTSASAKRPATSNPVCLAISTNPVGLVTLISVR